MVNLNTIPYYITFGIHEIYELDKNYKPIVEHSIDFRWEPTLYYVNPLETNRTVCPQVQFYKENPVIEKQFKEDARQSCIHVTTSSMNCYLYNYLNNNIGSMNLQVIMFTKTGYSVHGYFNETQMVE